MAETTQPAPQDMTVDPFGTKDPIFKVADHLGKITEYDPFEIAKKLEKVASDPATQEGMALTKSIDLIRVAFNFPTSEQVEESKTKHAAWKKAHSSDSQEPVILRTPSAHSTLALFEKFMEFFNGMSVLKNLQGLTRN